MKKFLTFLGVFLVGSLTSLGIAYAIFTPPTQFPDVDYDAYYGDALNTMVSLGVISGYSDGNFGPNDPVTRAQLVTILDRYGNGLFNGNNNGYGSEVMLLLCSGVDKNELASGYQQEVYEKYCEAAVAL
ncbi:MAG: S-layer homology domain-containing protein [Patescibacteria group bacterium]